jgi:hypothetical protein
MKGKRKKFITALWNGLKRMKNILLMTAQTHNVQNMRRKNRAIFTIS